MTPPSPCARSLDGSLVLVTGATGFIGRRVCALAGMDGLQVLATGRCVGALEALARDADALAAPPLTARIDWCDASQAAALARKWPEVTHIVHLASPVPGRHGDSIGMLHEGCTQILNLLEASEHWPVRHLVYVSSVAVYGIHAIGVLEEGATLSDDVGPYGMMKRIGEELVEWWSHRRDVPVAILRPAQVYGPGEPHGLGLSRMMRAALAGGPLTLQNGGQDERDCVYVCDVAKAIIAAVQKCATGVYNISSGESHPIREMADIIAATAGRDVRVDTLPVTTPVFPTVYSNAAAREDLGVIPVSLNVGIAGTMEAESGHQEGRI